MPVFSANTPIHLDVTTLFVVAVCVTALLGVLLLFAYMHDRVRALAWWGSAYLIGGFSVVIWSIESHISPPLPPGTANALLFFSCGMIWNAARLFHGRPVLWGAMATGATVWFIACMIPEFVQSVMARIVLSSLIVSVYTFLTAAELWRERRKNLLRRWPAIFVPILHGMVFLCPIPLASALPQDSGVVALATGWMAVFSLEVMLYIVGTAFIVLVLSKERAVRVQRNVASTDELTGLLNRRGFIAAARLLSARQAKSKQAVSVLMFDLDHFKTINDRFGHAVGDEALRRFATVAGTTLRASDIVGRYGGEEFMAVLPSTREAAAIAAERVRAAFEAGAAAVVDCPIAATVSIGVASGEPGADIMTMLAAADAALYRAKTNGRNRIEIADELAKAVPASAPRATTGSPAAAPFAVPLMASSQQPW
jgi:diguanylate cyclase (GGDEF)-like protein